MSGARGVREADAVISDLERRLDREVRRITSDLGADVVTAFVYDEDNACFHLPSGCGLRDIKTFKNPRLSPRSGRVAGRVARERQVIIAPQVQGNAAMDGPFARR